MDCSKCRFKCSSSFTTEDRTKICHDYWSLKEYTRQKDFILQNVTCAEPQRRRARKADAKERQTVRSFYFEKGGKKIRICQAFFLKTLAISNGPLINAFQNKNSSGVYAEEDKRGKHRPINKTSDDQISKIKQHIESFPITESHYVRKSSSRKYLDSKLSIAKMYALYEELCEERGDSAPSFSTYKRIFGEHYNYSFFKPKKDQCTLCVRYNSGNEEQKQNLQKEYDNHMSRKEDANSSKKIDKERASTDKKFVTATFDLQSVLQIPCSDVSPMYYASKVCCYNLTIYEGATPNNAFCYTWTEINGKRGSLEIGTCLYRYLKQLPKGVTEVSLFSDTCGGQNRNQNVAAMLMYMVQNTQLNIIEQKFLEPGHSMMECDSMHSTIEAQKKHIPVYLMNDWLNIFRMARSTRTKKSNKPYSVTELKFNDFLDLSALSMTIIRNKRRDTEGNIVNWMKVKCFKYEKESPGIIHYKYNHSGEYKKINVSGKGRPVTLPSLLGKAYEGQLPISEKKYTSIMTLCTNNAIPEEYQHWYKTLPHSKKVRNANPGPSMDESESENEF